jgi:hypothetical protein
LPPEAKTLRVSTSCARLRPKARFSDPQSYVLNSCRRQVTGRHFNSVQAGNGQGGGERFQDTSDQRKESAKV